jgi:hypothetical protein
LSLVEVSRVEIGLAAGEAETLTQPVLNAAGDIAYRTRLPTGERAIQRYSGGSVETIVYEGMPSPDGNGTFGFMSEPSMNAQGQMVFRSNLVGTAGGTADDRAIFYSGGNVLSALVREGDAAPDGVDTFTAFAGTTLNDAGEMAFGGYLDNGNAILRKSDSGIQEIAKDGQPAPWGGTYSEIDFKSAPILNNVGEVLVYAAGQLGFVISDGTTTQEILRNRQLAPDNIHEFVISQSLNTYKVAMNDQGQVGLKSALIVPSQGRPPLDTYGLFVFDDDRGWVQVVQTGDSFLGSEVEFIDFSAGFGDLGEGRGGMSSSGPARVAFRFGLEDGRTGIAAWTFQLPGDFNNDGYVDAADYTTWRNGLGTEYTPDDYQRWKDHLGTSIYGSGASSVELDAVPEPGTGVLVAMGLVMGIGLARSRGRECLMSND